jgi:hypothetical protein
VYDIAEPERWFDALPDFKTEKRRREWMLSRIAEKILQPKGFVSYSHSRGYGAAAVDDQPIGIDVEVVRALSLGAAHLFLSDAEERAAAECAIPNALLHFWSAKEARWKQLGGSVPTLKKVPIEIVQVREDGIHFDVAETVRINDLVIALSARRSPIADRRPKLPTS